MDAAVVTAIAGVAVAVVTAVMGPVLVKRAERNDPAAGWQAAIAALRDSVDEERKQRTELAERVDELSKEIKTLEETVSTRDRTIREKDRIIAEQSEVISAQGSRIVQLETSWPPGTSMPPVDPAFRASMRAHEASG